MTKTELAKMIFLIQRRTDVTHEELIMQWFKNHMPAVIASQDRAKERGHAAAQKYIAQLFNGEQDGNLRWDGMAQLWFAEPQQPGRVAGLVPSDTFQQKAKPYTGWATREYVVIDGAEHLDSAPLTLNEPYPSTRSGFFRVNYLVTCKPSMDVDALHDHWLKVHVPNARESMEKVGGFRYVVNHSIYPSHAPYAGMAELYFHDVEGWREWRKDMTADGIENWIDQERTLVMHGDTEMIGIPDHEEV